MTSLRFILFHLPTESTAEDPHVLCPHRAPSASKSPPTRPLSTSDKSGRERGTGLFQKSHVRREFARRQHRAEEASSQSRIRCAGRSRCGEDGVGYVDHGTGGDTIGCVCAGTDFSLSYGSFAEP